MQAGHAPSGEEEPHSGVWEVGGHRKAHGLFTSTLTDITSDSSVHSGHLFQSHAMLHSRIHRGCTQPPEIGSRIEKNDSDSPGEEKSPKQQLCRWHCFLFNKEPWKPCFMSIADLKAADYSRWLRWKPCEPNRALPLQSYHQAWRNRVRLFCFST